MISTTTRLLPTCLSLFLLSISCGCVPEPEGESASLHPAAEGAPLELTGCGVLGLGTPSAVAYSPSGELMAVASTAGVIKLYRASDGAEVRTLLGHSGGVSAVAFSPDGRWLFANVFRPGFTVAITGPWDDLLEEFP